MSGNKVINENINKCLSSLIALFKKYPGIFLTEEDVRNHLFCLLLPYFGKLLKTRDGKVSMPLHSEVRWYGENQDRRELSDLVLIDVSDLKVDKHGRFPLPSKSYGFNNFYAAIEIKLRRAKYSPNNNRWLSMLRKDVKKLQFLKDGVKNKHDPFLCLVAFDKKEDISESIEVLSNDKTVEVYYECI